MRHRLFTGNARDGFLSYTVDLETRECDLIEFSDSPGLHSGDRMVMSSEVTECEGLPKYAYFRRRYAPMPAIRVIYTGGLVCNTDMAANLKDSEMLSYFAPGRWFNVGFETGREDDMRQIVSAEITDGISIH